MMKMKYTREQILALAAGVLFAGVSVIAQPGGRILKDGNMLERAGYGGEVREYLLNVEGLQGADSQINIHVSPREYTEEEAKAAFEEIMDGLSAQILGPNPSLQEITEDLDLKKTLQDYPGIRLSWRPKDTEMISSTGKVNRSSLPGPADTELAVTLKAGEWEEMFVLPVRILPLSVGDQEESIQALEEVIAQADRDQIFRNELTLPEELNGIRVSYAMPRKPEWLKPILAGIAASVLLGFRPTQEKKQAAKRRENELLLDYAEVVSKLLVYLGAGMTVRNAWIRVTESYLESKEAGRVLARAAYEEMCIAAAELKKGVSERRVYADFAHRCGPKCYLKLASILEQNLRTGDRRMETALELEMQEAFEQRKNTARRLGEEAGTKLILPLMISLVTVMIIVAVPALFSLT